MNIFPLLGNIDLKIRETINSRRGNNLEVTKLMCWLRVASAVPGKGHNGLILESVTRGRDFQATYGGQNINGVVGYDFDGKPVRASRTNERGLRPSPVIESANIEQGHLGLSRKATFSIKCFTLGQAEKITQHFLEPGYHVLVEFGWNTPESFQQRADLSSNGPCQMAKFNIYDYVIRKRINSKGTYDGFMGQTTGGSLQMGDDETYIVDVELVTIGEIPAYLQTQKGSIRKRDAQDADEDSTTGLLYDTEEIERARENNNIGESLFKQMFNRLPPHKRTEQVKALLEKKDMFGNPFKTQYNFINMDEEIRSILMEDINKIKVDGKKIKIPDGIELFSDQGFIRLELAFEILNASAVNLESVAAKGCSVKTYSYKIQTRNVIIRGHKHMFSLDESKLYIPNPNLPDFGLKTVLIATDENELKAFPDLENTINGNPWREFATGQKYTFPSQENLTPETQNIDVIEGAIIQRADAHTWGFLNNLYINFDFFLSVINRSNYVVKDCYYELLNGLSNACNSLWQFEITESPDNEKKIGSNSDKPLGLTVQDFSFLGKVSSKDISQIAIFDPIGSNSPFLSFNINMDIPAAMKNSILGERASLTTNVDGKEPKIGFLFKGQPDPVWNLINTFEREVPTPEEQEDEAEGNANAGRAALLAGQGNLAFVLEADRQKRNIKALRKASLEAFSEIGVIIPFIYDIDQLKYILGTRSSVDFDSTQLIQGIYNDPIYLKKVEMGKEGDSVQSDKSVLDPAVLSVEVTFDLHGISGIKVGDILKFSKLPQGYDKPFQVMEISHALSDTVWTTSVKAKLRNI